MPDNLAPDKRRMIEWLQETGRWSERKLILEKCKSIVDGEQKKTVTKPSFAAIPAYPLNFDDVLALEKVAFVQFDRQGIQNRIDLGHSGLGSEFDADSCHVRAVHRIQLDLWFFKTRREISLGD